MLERSPIADVDTVSIGMWCQSFKFTTYSNDDEAKQPQPFTM